MTRRPRTFLYCQSDSLAGEPTTAKQEAVLREDLAKFDLEHNDAVPVIETSYRRRPFHLRHMGSWLLRNVGRKDTVVVHKIIRLGSSAPDALRTLKAIHRRGASVVIAHFNGDAPLSLSGHVFAFFVDLMDGVVNSAVEIKRAALRETTDRIKIGRGKYQWGCRTEMEANPRSPHGETGTKLVWDSTQLRYCADIARRLFLEKEPAATIIKEYHQLGIVDHTGRPFGKRFKNTPDKNVSEAFREAACFFMRMGVDGMLPPQWNDVAIQIDWKAKERGLEIPWDKIRSRKIKRQSP